MKDVFFTAKQVQDLLQVDRTTIYRMIKDGRLQGVKVGKHWRFPVQAVNQLLHGQQPTPGENSGSARFSFPLPGIQTIQDIFAEVSEVAVITTRVDGTPITEMSNPSEFSKLVYSSPAGRQACIASWQKLAIQKTDRPEFIKCHAGLMHARVRIDVNDELVAILVAGQFFIEKPDRQEMQVWLKNLEREFQIDFHLLQAAAEQIPILSVQRVAKISGWLEKVAQSFIQIGMERGALFDRLRQISAISFIDGQEL